MAVFEFAAGKTDGMFIRFSLKIPIGALMMLRMHLT